MLRTKTHPRLAKLGLERLEAREVPTVQLNLLTQSVINSYQDVGFRQNIVAGLNAFVNGRPDLNLSNYQAEVRYSPGGGWEPGTILLNGAGGSTRMLVKGSHTYADAGLHPVQVKVTGPGGVTETKQTTSVVVTQLPSGVLGTEPPQVTPLMQPSNSSMNVYTTNAINSYAGVGFRMTEIGGLNGYVNGQRDLAMGNYRFHINWGDSAGWSEGVLAPNGAGSSVAFLLKGTHTYAQAGQYKVVVHVTGPDGTTVSENTTTAIVSQLPSGVPGVEPPLVAAARPPAKVDLNVYTASMVTSYAGVGFRLNEIGGLAGFLNGQQHLTSGDYRVHINWGDSSQWHEGVVTPNGSGGSVKFLLKGTHTYAEAGQYKVVVYVTGPDGTAASEHTTTALVHQMPNGKPGVEPAVVTTAMPPGDVSLNLYTTSVLTTTAGDTVGAYVGGLTGFLNGQLNFQAGDYRVQINWGDSGRWFDGAVTPNGAGGSVKFLLSGSHRYLTPGTYPVVVHVTGPDGTTVSDHTTSVTVVGTRVYQIDKEKFLQAYQAVGSGFGHTFQARGRLNASQLAGLSRLIDQINADPALTRDPRWIAYLMATVRHETKRPVGRLGWFETWQPVNEVGLGRGRLYGTTYFGRGFVQLTWRGNYARATQKLRAYADAWGRPEWKTIDLVRNPALALDPDVSYFVASVGMREGWFGHYAVRDARGRVIRYGDYRLADFFNARRTDWGGARRIVNGLDRAQMIGADAAKLFGLLRRSWAEG